MLDKKVAALELALVKFSESVEERGEDTEDKLEVRLGVSLGTMLGMEGMQHGEGSSQHTDYVRSWFGFDEEIFDEFWSTLIHQMVTKKSTTVLAPGSLPANLLAGKHVFFILMTWHLSVSCVLKCKMK